MTVLIYNNFLENTVEQVIWYHKMPWDKENEKKNVFPSLTINILDKNHTVQWKPKSCIMTEATMSPSFTTLFFRSSVQFSRSVLSNSLRPHESQHTRPPCPSPTPRVHSDSRPSSQWCHPAISSSVVPFSSCPQSFPASGSFPMSQLFAWGGQSIGVSASASVLPMNTQN